MNKCIFEFVGVQNWLFHQKDHYLFGGRKKKSENRKKDTKSDTAFLRGVWVLECTTDSTFEFLECTT